MTAVDIPAIQIALCDGFSQTAQQLTICNANRLLERPEIAGLAYMSDCREGELL